MLEVGRCKAWHQLEASLSLNIKYRVFFLTGPTQKSSKYGTGPPQYRKMTKFIKDSNISTNKSESPSQSLSDLNFSANLQQKVKV